MRLAILSDIHGNPLALDIGQNGIQRQGGTDGYLVLGDFVALPTGCATSFPSCRNRPDNFHPSSR